MDTPFEIKMDEWIENHPNRCFNCRYVKEYYINGNQNRIGTFCCQDESENYGLDTDEAGGCGCWVKL